LPNASALFLLKTKHFLGSFFQKAFVAKTGSYHDLARLPQLRHAMVRLMKVCLTAITNL